MSNNNITLSGINIDIDDVVDTAHAAANEILKIYNTDFLVENKDDDSPLTAADTAAHEVISQRLRELTPDIPILSEESSAKAYETRQQWSRYWLVDPLDGTREFVKRNGEFTVNIALIVEHSPALGVVQIPATGVCYHAAAGLGAFKHSPGEEPARLHTRPTAADQFIVAGSRSHATDRQKAFFAALGDNTEIISAGSSLKFCLVAEGRVDIYPRFGPTSEWDTAAAQCIVTEAGGLVTDLDLRPLEYNRKDSLLNPEFLVIGDPSFDWKPYLDKISEA
ncbi:MAG: 3'(2'),5'-bisphosphate nucleotidase CysQ [Gammaproteobacteria bacterium]